MHKQKRVFFPWFAWHTEKIELYLEEMAAQGWQVRQVGFSQMWFRFIKEAPERIRFCVDYQWKPEAEYEHILADDGWELVDHTAGWMLWKKPFEDVRPNLYTDTTSLIERNQRIIMLVGFCLLAQMPAVTTNAFTHISQRYLSGMPVFGGMLTGFYFLLILTLVFGMFKLALLNKRLKN